ncbi:MAG: hypothetical protein M1814_004568 [Vezdaea aestivalis]|nr:MAG: hypothetical protein M1814_004568 [Vezdaea aestivalis]
MAMEPLFPGVEMFQRQRSSHLSFLDPMAPAPPRPLSTATEIFDLDYVGDFEEDDNSPRISIESHRRDSDANTISSDEEATTPINEDFADFDFQLECRPVQGPVGPHLFRASQDSTQAYSFHLSMSPVTPKAPPKTITPDDFYFFKARPLTSLPGELAALDRAEVNSWTPYQVAKWMRSANFDQDMIDKFERHDISGPLLLDLKFDDLKELDIQSYGKRKEIWNKIHDLRIDENTTPIQEHFAGKCDSGSGSGSGSGSDDSQGLKKKKTRKNRKGPLNDDTVISPLESVSIVGIEQLIPKPHKCAKGENCPKFRRQQKQRALLAEEFPVSPRNGGFILMAGNPGNAFSAPNMRPTSEAVPSVVASSDVLGPGPVPLFIDEDNLRNMQSRDPQENVKQFLDLQQAQQHAPCDPEDEFEMFPQHDSPMNHNQLPRLIIPANPPRSFSAQGPESAMGIDAITALPLSHGEAQFNQFAGRDVYRIGSPASEMDVPVTAVPLGPVARDASQSVPPDMKYRREPTTSRRTSARVEHARPAFAMAKVDEDKVWSPSAAAQKAPTAVKSEYSQEGWMKKRKAKLLRHEWHEHHFRLKGTELAMHKDEISKQQLERIDVDNYAVACSSMASGKLSAAFKTMKLSGKKKDGDDAAFSFQLVPASEKMGKTHHFAVKNRDERIDWMRELMLAKALKQRGDACEVAVNGNMI